MKIIFYYNTSEKNKIGKTLINAFETNCTLKSECKITEPEIVVECESLVGYNFCYIPDFKRYYFINEMTSVRNGIWRIALSVDVLESYKIEILNLVCIVDKQNSGSLSSNYIDDGSYVNEVKNKIEVLNFPSGFNESADFILVTAGA